VHRHGDRLLRLSLLGRLELYSFDVQYFLRFTLYPLPLQILASKTSEFTRYQIYSVLLSQHDDRHLRLSSLVTLFSFTIR
jgi:hypothetical protein